MVRSRCPGGSTRIVDIDDRKLAQESTTMKGAKVETAPPPEQTRVEQSPSIPRSRSMGSASGGGSVAGSTSSHQKPLPQLFVLIEKLEWHRVNDRVRRHPKEASVWATVKKTSAKHKSSANRSEANNNINSVRCKALHHACYRLRSVHNQGPLPVSASLSNEAAKKSHGRSSSETDASRLAAASQGDAWIEACESILAIIGAYPEAAQQRESRHGCLPLHLAAFSMCPTSLPPPSSSPPPPPPPQSSNPTDADASSSSPRKKAPSSSSKSPRIRSSSAPRRIPPSSSTSAGRRSPLPPNLKASGSALGRRISTSRPQAAGDAPPRPPKPELPMPISPSGQDVTGGAESPPPPPPEPEPEKPRSQASMNHSPPPTPPSTPLSLRAKFQHRRSFSHSSAEETSLGGISDMMESEFFGYHSDGEEDDDVDPRRRSGYEVRKTASVKGKGVRSAAASEAVSVAGGSDGSQEEENKDRKSSPPPLPLTASSSSSDMHQHHDSGTTNNFPDSEAALASSTVDGGAETGKDHELPSEDQLEPKAAPVPPFSPPLQSVDQPDPVLSPSRSEKEVEIETAAPLSAPRGAVAINTTLREDYSIKVIDALLDAFPKGARVDSEGGRLPLHTAVAGRASVRVITTLLRAYPDAARSRNKDGYLPLHLAAHWGVSDAEVAPALLRAYPDATVGRNRWERTPLEEALGMAGENGRPHQEALVKCLRRHPSVWTRPHTELSNLLALPPASAPQSPQRPKQPTKHELVDIDETIIDDVTPAEGDVSEVRDSAPLLGPRAEEKGDKEADDYNGRPTQNQQAAHQRGNGATQQSILSRMSPRYMMRKSQSSSGGSYRRKKPVKDNDRAGEDPSSPEASALTDLGSLLKMGLWHMVVARCQAEPGEARDILSVMVRGGYPARVTPLYVACEMDPALAAVEALVVANREAVYVRKAPGGQLPLHAACTWLASWEVVDLLLRTHADAARVRDDLGNLPLHCACYSGADAEVVEALLITFPRAVWGRNGQGFSPSEICRRLRHENRRTILALLERHSLELLRHRRAAGEEGSSPMTTATTTASPMTTPESAVSKEDLKQVLPSPKPKKSNKAVKRGRRMSASRPEPQAPAPATRTTSTATKNSEEDDGMLWV